MVNETNNGYTVQFSAYNDDCPYETIEVSIDKSYQITKITVLEAEDMGYTISISNIKKNVNLSDNQFKFQSTDIQKSKVRDLRNK
jgi:outer membrane lipoprotein-sorting protein